MHLLVPMTGPARAPIAERIDDADGLVVVPPTCDHTHPTSVELMGGLPPLSRLAPT